jgi:hypothetical protein
MKKEIQELKNRIAKLEAQLNKPVIQEIPAKTLEWGEMADEEMTWEEAQKWCESQGDGWRLPTIDELYKAWYDKVPGFAADVYWSATEDSEAYASLVGFTSGSAGNFNKTNDYYVRCVRTVN